MTLAVTSTTNILGVLNYMTLALLLRQQNYLGIS